MATQVEVPERRSVDIGGPVSYREWEGPEDRTFVLVHGLGGSLLNWIQVAPSLARIGRVVAPDLAGFGRTPLAGRSSRLTDQRRLLSAFIERTASGRAVVSGNSMGGVLGMLQAALEPGTVDRLILTDSAFPPQDGARPAALVRLGFALYEMQGVGEWVVRQRFRHISPERQMRLILRVVAADPTSIPPDIVRLHEELLGVRANDPDAAAAFLEAARSLLLLKERPGVAAWLFGSIRCPVLVLHGRRDRLVPVEYAETAVAEHPTWTLHEFPDLGHIPQMEAPDRWLEAVEDWLNVAAATS